MVVQCRRCHGMHVHIALLGVAVGGYAGRKTERFRPLAETSHHFASSWIIIVGNFCSNCCGNPSGWMGGYFTLSLIT